MTRNVTDAVLALNDYAIDRLTSRLKGLSDEAQWWQPIGPRPRFGPVRVPPRILLG